MMQRIAKHFLWFIILLGYYESSAAGAINNAIASYNQEITVYYQSPQSQNNNISKRVTFASAWFLGRPYFDGALGEGSTGEFDQFPLYRTDLFDCTTYVATILALVQANNLEQFQERIKQINYYNGEVDFFNRNHFISVQWNTYNQQQGFIKDITNNIRDKNGNSVAKNLEQTINLPDWYLKLNATHIRHIKKISPEEKQILVQKLHGHAQAIQPLPSHLSYLPLNSLYHDKIPNTYIFQQIPSGSIIEIVISTPSYLQNILGTRLDVMHMGFAIRTSQGLMFREASEFSHRVEDVPLEKYLLALSQRFPNVLGINIEEVT